MTPDPDSPPPPRPLEYRRPMVERVPSATPAGSHWALGFTAWVTAVGAWISIAAAARGAPAVLWTAAGAILVGLVTLCVWVRVRLAWRGFLPGVLIGFGLTCLVPAGIVAVVCGPWHR